VFTRHVDAVVTGLSWKRTVVVEQGRWVSRRMAWKPHGGNVRNLRAVQVMEPDIMGGGYKGRAGASMPASTAHEVLTKHTYYEYEEFEWHKYRSFTAKGDSPADVHWPEYALEADQRISDQRQAYHVRFSAAADGRGTKYTTDLDEATWRTLRMGLKCRLKVGSFSDEVKDVTVLGRGR